MAATDQALGAGNRPATVGAGRSFWQRSEQTRSAYAYLLPALLVLGIITLFPLLFQVWMSFTDYGIGNLDIKSPPPNFVGLRNYIQILTNDPALTASIPNFD